jgi:hypothetical protein
MDLLVQYFWHETAIFTKHKHVILSWVNSMAYITHDGLVLPCPISDVSLRKYQKCDGTLQWTTAPEIVLPNTICQKSSNRYIGYTLLYKYNSKNYVFDHGIISKPCKRRRWCVEIFNIIRNKRSSNNLVAKTDPMELNKRHRHSNWCTIISAILFKSYKL